MSIPLSSIVKNKDSSWTFIWPDQGQTFSRVVLWAVELANGSIFTYTWRDFEYRGDFPPPIEIAYEDQQVLSEQFSPFLIIQWYGLPTALKYLIQQSTDNGATYQIIETFQESGSWIYTYSTVVLADENSYLYQVIAVDDVGNVSTPRHFARYVVTPPPPPDGSYYVSYAAGTITIAGN